MVLRLLLTFSGKTHKNKRMMREHVRFQLEATKLGRTVVFQVTVFERTDKAKKTLFAETQCTDPLHFLLQFIVKDATDFDDLLHKFIQELSFRGFEPVRYRVRGLKAWGGWTVLHGQDGGVES
jgi:hypothetical protein